MTKRASMVSLQPTGPYFMHLLIRDDMGNYSYVTECSGMSHFESSISNFIHLSFMWNYCKYLGPGWVR